MNSDLNGYCPTVKRCPICLSDEFRRSKVRLTDVLQVMVLRLPVRCYRCQSRYFTFVLAFLLSE